MMEFRFHDENKPTTYSTILYNLLEKFDELRKEIVLHNANCFNERNINIGTCNEILIHLIYLLNQGEEFSNNEKQTLFFNVSKLFRSNDIQLRRNIFIFLKHLTFDANFSFILTGTLLNEIQKNDALLKANSLRVLGHIIDSSNTNTIERFLKNVFAYFLTF